MSKLNRELIAKSMLSSIENYVFEVIDSVENEVGVLTTEDHHSINSCVRNAVEKAAAELDSEQNVLRPVGVMSEKAFHRLENSESRFIALWPRPEIYLPRKRPDDCVIVYARIASAGSGVKGE